MQVAYPCLKPLNSWFSDFEETMLFVSCHLPGFVRMAQGLERATYSILVGSVINTPNFVHLPWNVAISFDVHKESRSLRKHVSVGRICVAYIVVILWPIWNSWLCIVRIIPGFSCVLSGVTCQHTLRKLGPQERIQFMASWLKNGPPASFWVRTLGIDDDPHGGCWPRFPALARMTLHEHCKQGLDGKHIFLGVDIELLQVIHLLEKMKCASICL